MSHPARISLRAPPHLPFIQGYPGIPAGPNRKPPAICGTVEVRVGSAPIKAKWVRVEIRKHELVPAGFPVPSASSSTSGDTWEHVGEINNLWKPTEGKEFADLETADFHFSLPLPQDIPPSVEVMKGGIRYELVAALCYRSKGGIFKKDSPSIIKVSEHITITKHELLSAWSIYDKPEPKTAQDSTGALTMTVQRPTSAIGPTDKILLTATLKSSKPQPFKVKGFECHLHELLTVRPVAQPKDAKAKKNKPLGQPVTKSRTLASARAIVNETIGRGGEKSARIEMAVPAEALAQTVQTARSLDIVYELEVKAVSEGMPELKMPGIRYTVGPLSRGHAVQAIADIGYVEALSGGNGLADAVRHTLLDPGVQPNSRPSSVASSARTQPGVQPMNPAQPSYPPQSAYMNNRPMSYQGPGPGPGSAPGIAGPSMMGNQGFPNARPAIQGFTPREGLERRKSSETSATVTSTTTITNLAPTPDFSPTPNSNGRPYSTGPNMRQNLAFPSPQPGLQRAASTATSFSSDQEPNSPTASMRYAQSDMGHGNEKNRPYSTMTTGTFGNWDSGLKGNMSANMDKQSSSSSSIHNSFISGGAIPVPGPSRQSTTLGPSTAWISAESEKLRLYHNARSTAAKNQAAGGVPLDRIGLDDIPNTAPPEYAPPIPGKPSNQYTAPARPVSTYTVSTNAASRPQSPHTPEAGGSSSNVPDIPKRSEIPGGSPYLSAAEEKEQQRKRYEAAQRRIVSGSSAAGGSGVPAGSSSGPSTPGLENPPQIVTTPPIDSPLSYDEVAANPPKPSASTAGPSKLMGSMGTPAVLSAADEKEQMKRYYAARDQVDRASRGESSSGSIAQATSSSSQTAYSSNPRQQLGRTAGDSSTGSQAGPSQPSKPPVPKEYLSAAEEKEMMRKRYEEATRKVSQTQGIPLSPTLDDPPPPPIDAPFAGSSGTSGSGNSGAGGSKPNGVVTTAPIQNQAPKTWMSAEEEKDMMRKRYEDATRKVSHTQGVPLSPTMDETPPPIDAPFAGPSGSSGSSSGPSQPLAPSPQVAKTWMSAEEEKDMMRKRYEEATRKVSQTQNPQGMMSPSPSMSSMTTMEPPTPIITSTPPTFGSTTGGSSSKPQSYMTAAEEKEMMKKRYDDATKRVSRVVSGGPPPMGASVPFSPAPGLPASGPPPQQSITKQSFASASEEKDAMRKRYEEATAKAAGGPVPRNSLGPQSTNPFRQSLSNGDTSSRAGPSAPTSSTGQSQIPAATAQVNIKPSGSNDAATIEDAPPPPLPARPPMDYINLLSPVVEGDEKGLKGLGIK